MRALVTGADGQLGRALQELLPEAVFATAKDLDITDTHTVASYDWSDIDAIINAAAFTKVDAAEDPESLLPSWDVNVTGVANLATQARIHDIPFVSVSSDYVFAGDATEPIPVDAKIDPQSVYGLEKAAGELAAKVAHRHYIIRTSWMFGDGPNFVTTMRKLAQNRPELTVVSDQLGRPTYAGDLASALISLITTKAAPGIYHFSNSGDVISWAEFATTIFKMAGDNCTVTPVSTADYLAGKSGIAPRPAYSALDLSKTEAAGITIRDWRAALADYLDKEHQ